VLGKPNDGAPVEDEPVVVGKEKVGVDVPVG